MQFHSLPSDFKSDSLLNDFVKIKVLAAVERFIQPHRPGLIPLHDLHAPYLHPGQSMKVHQSMHIFHYLEHEITEKCQ